ncbi:hypothetical protein ARMGADRAFT_118162 [Armillaria gallica]|uniref:Uncharacterized protein n=1 Tax=Armillaria gallica TaxID=47427 RepID=A0A2H3CEB2_ARMGA|nr:hypothetical protein ARMGADRAFT_118162 [Armillaria gallica]
MLGTWKEFGDGRWEGIDSLSRSPVRSATLKLSPLDNSHPDTKQNHIPLPSNLRFSLRCCIHLVLNLVRLTCITTTYPMLHIGYSPNTSRGSWCPNDSAYAGETGNHEGNHAQGPTMSTSAVYSPSQHLSSSPHSLLRHSASASSSTSQISTSASFVTHRTSILPSDLNKCPISVFCWRATCRIRGHDECTLETSSRGCRFR